jgi:hypothetical protein
VSTALTLALAYAYKKGGGCDDSHNRRGSAGTDDAGIASWGNNRRRSAGVKLNPVLFSCQEHSPKRSFDGHYNLIRPDHVEPAASSRLDSTGIIAQLLNF